MLFSLGSQAEGVVLSGNLPVIVAEESKSMVNRVLTLYAYTQTNVYHISFAKVGHATDNCMETENSNPTMFLEGEPYWKEYLVKSTN